MRNKEGVLSFVCGWFDVSLRRQILVGSAAKKSFVLQVFCIDGKFCFVYLYSSTRIWFDVGEVGAIKWVLNFEDGLCLRYFVLCQKGPALEFGGKDVGVSR